MVRKLFLFILILGVPEVLAAQTPQVPSEMRFADIELRITDGARKEIQSHVDALYRSEKFFKIKLERVNLYFPIIEKIFREEDLPEDFKYLVIQESALISDAISSSNAVGFWQFKKASGEEVGLRIDGSVDERLNIVSSSRGAARYLKRNNKYFGNWLYALLSYNMGAGGAQKVVDEKKFGAKKMEIDKRTHWYIIKFLAHKVAFENATGRNPTPSLMLTEYNAGANKSLKQIASETRADGALVEEYNKWLKRGTVPSDKIYSVIIPTPYSDVGNMVAIDYNNGNSSEASDPPYETPTVSLNSRFSRGSDKYPVIEGEVPATLNKAVPVKVNGKPGIIAGPNENLLELAETGEIPISKFLKYNDLNSGDKVVPGQVYYLKPKRGRAAEHHHVISPSDNLWSISQKYGIKLKKILQKNRMEKGEQPKPGRVLWLRFVRPKDTPIEYQEVVDSENIEDHTRGQRVNIPQKENKVERNLPPAREVEKQVVDPETEEQNTSAAGLNQMPADTEVEITDPNPDEDRLEQDSAPSQEKAVEAEKDAFSADSDVKFVEAEEPVTKVPQPEADGIHRVKKGETLYSIARQYNIQLGEILLWNNISLRDEIKIDQVLKITPPEDQTNVATENPVIKEEDFIIHEVATGETMYKIARDHNVTIKDVMQWNNKNDFKVSIGEKLKIKKPVN